MPLLGFGHNILRDANGKSTVQRVRACRTDSLTGYDLDVTLAELCGFDYVIHYLTPDLRLDVIVDLLDGDKKTRWKPSENVDDTRKALITLGRDASNDNLQSMLESLKQVVAERAGPTVSVPYLDEGN